MLYFLLLIIASRCAASLSSPKLRFATRIGCQHWSPTECWLPGFAGTDSSPTVSATGVVYVGSYDTHTYALNSTDGSVLWKTKSSAGEGSPALVGAAEGGSDIVTWGGTSFMAQVKGDELLRLDGTTGEVVWSWSAPGDGKIVTSGAVDDKLGLVFAGTSSPDEVFFALDVNTGAQKWSYGTGGAMWGTLGPLLVDLSGGHHGTATALVCVGAGGSADFSADCKAQLHCFHRASGQLAWSAATGRQIQSRPSFGATSGNIFVGDYDGCLYAFHARTGAAKWKQCTKGMIEGSSAVAATPSGEVVMVPSFDGYMHAFDGVNGTERWRARLGTTGLFPDERCASTPRVSKDGLVAYAGGPNGVWALDTQTGDALWFYKTTQSSQSGTLVGSSPVLSEDGAALFVGCEDGFLYSLETSLSNYT